MSTRSVRRHQSWRTEASRAARQPDRGTVGILLTHRDRMAQLAAECEAHGLAGSIDLARQKLDLETTIEAIAPEVYDAHWADWLRRDADLAHMEGATHPECVTCVLQAERGTRTVPLAA